VRKPNSEEGYSIVVVVVFSSERIRNEEEGESIPTAAISTPGKRTMRAKVSEHCGGGKRHGWFERVKTGV
jgi:hypothetical protein